MSDSQTSSVPETPTPISDAAISDWAALLPLTAPEDPPLTYLSVGVQFERQNRAVSRRRGVKQSPIWALGTYYTANNGKKEAWLCSQCNAFIKLGNSTGNAATHLIKHHPNAIQEATSMPPPRPSPRPSPSPSPAPQRTLYHDVNIEKWRAKLLRWMIQDHIPFAQVQSEAFRSMLIELYRPIGPYIVSGTTIRTWINEEYELAVDQIHSWLRDADSRVHISFDLWTSLNGYAMIGVYGHFVSGYSPTVKSILLALRRIDTGHSGEEVAIILVKIIKFWSLESRLGVFVGDNSEVNDIAINRVLEVLRPDIKDNKQRRSRCLGHIINLAARAFLFGANVDAFEQVADTGAVAIESAAARSAQVEWRKKGAVGKLHNLVIYIRSSSLRREAWKRKRVDSAEIDGELSYNKRRR